MSCKNNELFFHGALAFKHPHPRVQVYGTFLALLSVPVFTSHVSLSALLSCLLSSAHFLLSYSTLEVLQINLVININYTRKRIKT